MRRINSTFEGKGTGARKGDGGDFSFMLLLFSLDSSKRFSVIQRWSMEVVLKLERFWRETFLREIVTVFRGKFLRVFLCL